MYTVYFVFLNQNFYATMFVKHGILSRYQRGMLNHYLQMKSSSVYTVIMD